MCHTTIGRYIVQHRILLIESDYRILYKTRLYKQKKGPEGYEKRVKVYVCLSVQLNLLLIKSLRARFFCKQLLMIK